MAAALDPAWPEPCDLSWMSQIARNLTDAEQGILTGKQVLDSLRNTTTNPPGRVKEFSIKIGGGSYAKLFGGNEKLLSWDNILWINRPVSVP
jgi:hypothetical protein